MKIDNFKSSLGLIGGLCSSFISENIFEVLAQESRNG